MARTTFDIALGILWLEGHVWVQKRKGTGHLDGFWEFPGGKVEGSESPVDAAIREVGEETGLALGPEQLQYLDTHSFEYPERSVVLHCFLCRLPADPELRGGMWISVLELNRLKMPPANQIVIEKLKGLS